MALTKEQIIANLSQYAREAFGEAADLSQWLAHKSGALNMTPLELIENQPETAEETLGHYIDHKAAFGFE